MRLGLVSNRALPAETVCLGRWTENDPIYGYESELRPQGSVVRGPAGHADLGSLRPIASQKHSGSRYIEQAGAPTRNASCLSRLSVKPSWLLCRMQNAPHALIKAALAHPDKICIKAVNARSDSSHGGQSS